jgi:hypothetical protein
MPAWWLPYVREFIGRVQTLYNTVPFVVSSFGRTVSHNRAVGGASDSQHLTYTAADLVPTGGWTMDDLEASARESQLFAFVLNEGDHVHVQLFRAGQIPPNYFAAIARA